MQKILPLAVAIIMLGGCVSTVRVDSLNSIRGIEYGHIAENGAEVIKSYTVSSAVKKDITNDDLKSCLAKNITNRDVSLSDSSRSFVGAYTGNYYNISSSQKSSGGDVINAEMSNGVIFSGSGKYRTEGVLAVERAVRFTGEIKSQAQGANIEFSNIEQAQLDTGAISNTGFYKVGTSKFADPEKVISVLDEQANKIFDCLSKK